MLKNSGKFNLFKIAQRLDGSYEDGYISSKDSLIFAHNQRVASDRIIISGNSVIKDRPKLDSRFSTMTQKRNPDVAILTRGESEIGREIELFLIPDRRVDIFGDIDSLPLDFGYSIIEGGWNLFCALREKIDMVELIISPKILSGRGALRLEEFGGRILHSQRIGDDVLIFIDVRGENGER